MSKNSIFIFEFISGGGFSQVNMPTSLFCEGFSMLRSIIADFKDLGFEIYTLLDSRVSFLSKFLKADEIRKVSTHENYLKSFKKLLNSCKYVFIIAPETSNILYKLTRLVKKYNIELLSTNLDGIKNATSKIKTYDLFKKSSISTPKTYKIPYKKKQLDIDFIIRKFKLLECPIVIKPEDGVGAESTFYFEKESEILNFFRNNELNSVNQSKYILQEYIEGEDLSISLIGNKNTEELPIIIAVNSQEIDIKNSKFEYYGGHTPIENINEFIGGIYSIFKNLNFPAMEGYYGIDFKRKFNNSFSFIEINPRLTTSYIGLRNILNLNCAELILNSRFNILNKTEIKYINHSRFARLDFFFKDFKNVGKFEEEILPNLIKSIPEFVTPPISLDNSPYFSCFIATKTKDCQASNIRVNEIISYMKDFNFDFFIPRKAELL